MHERPKTDTLDDAFDLNPYASGHSLESSPPIAAISEICGPVAESGL
jgi:hypothetical protein